MSQERYLSTIFLAILALYVLPYYILGQDIPITIHDNLDSNLVWLKLAQEHASFFSPSDLIIEPFMGGQKLSTIVPIYDIAYFVISLFGPFWGYVVVRTLMVAIGFLGMKRLIRVAVPEANSLIVMGVATCFAILPHWGFNLSIPSMPWLFLGLIRATKGDLGWKTLLILVFSGLASSLILTGIFVLAGFGVYLLLSMYRTRRFNLSLFWAMALVSATYVFTHWRIFAAFLGDSELMHRTDFQVHFSSQWVLIERALEIFWLGWPSHSASVHILILIITGFTLMLVWEKKISIWFLNAVEFIIISSVWYSMANWTGIAPATDLIKMVLPIQLQRLHFVQPLVWYLLFAWALYYFGRESKGLRKFIPLLLAAQILILFANHEMVTNRKSPTYRAFYAENLFNQAKEYLGPERAKERAIFVSSHPSILQYNGFYTLDGYSASYPLAYKRQFREIIAGELDKSESLKQGFDHWGSRAYAMVGVIGKEWVHEKGSDFALTDLDYNWDAFHAMGGRLIFSPFPIHDPDLVFLESFTDPDAAWDLFLYKTNSIQWTMDN